MKPVMMQLQLSLTFIETPTPQQLQISITPALIWYRVDEGIQF